MIEERSWKSVVFDTLNYVLLGSLALLCVLPLIHTAAVSLSGRAASEAGLVALWPEQFTLMNYHQVMMNLQFRRALLVSLLRLGVGVPLNLLLISLVAYPLSLNERFAGKNGFKWVLLFGMFFSGGLIPLYLTMRSLHLLDTLWALVLPSALPIFSVIVLLNFFRGLPPELAESASIDGASHWQILSRIYLPLSLPALATLTLFSAVGHWNAWFDGLVFMLKPSNYPLQSYLQISVILMNQMGLESADPDLLQVISGRSLRAAQIIFAALPILCLYPLLQRYFIKGLTLGSVKG